MQPVDIAIIMVVALIVFGPKKLPEAADELGQAVRELRRIADGAKETVDLAYKLLLSVSLLALIAVIVLNAAR